MHRPRSSMRKQTLFPLLFHLPTNKATAGEKAALQLGGDATGSDFHLMSP